MGRRGKNKKQSTNAGRDDTGSGEEENIPVRRRGRPQKPLKDEIDDEEVEKILKIEEEESESAKSSVSNKDVKKQSAAAIENGKKRKRASQGKEIPDSIKEENGVASKTDGLKAVGFRQNGSRRKNKPRRAAEVGVECKLVIQS